MINGLCRIQIGDVSIPGLPFADDTVILAESPQDLKEYLRKIESSCEKWKMSLNEAKCDISVYDMPGEGVRCSMFGTTVLLMQQYTYLILQMTADLDLSVIVQDKK